MMDARLEHVLKLVIEDYIETAEPIGSQALVSQHGLEMSPATIRNWFADLERLGMLMQPHTSAGRIPSEVAYRWYVATQLGEPALSKRERQAFEHIKETDVSSRVKEMAKLCATTAGVAAIAGTNKSDSYYTGLTALFRQPEFHDWSRVVNMGTVLDQLDERLVQLRQTHYDVPTILLGESCPFGPACGTVLVTLQNGSLIALFGPMRMPYKTARNLLTTALEYMK